MKRLSQETFSAPKTQTKKQRNKNTDSIVITIPVVSDAEAIEKKEQMLNTKLFGLFSPVKYIVKYIRKVYVPFELLIFSYQVDFGGKIRERSSLFHRDGETAIVFNAKETHAFHFDIAESINRCKVVRENLDGELLEDGCGKEEILERSLYVVKNKVLRRVYRNVSDLKLTKRERFYRPAWEMVVECRGREFIKYAYMDAYASHNEHISGLRTRLQS